MRQIFSPNAPHDINPSCAGNEFEPQYVKKFDRDGVPYLEHTHDVNIPECINSVIPPSATEIYNRALLGEIELLAPRPNAFYGEIPNIGDMTAAAIEGMKSAEILQKVSDASASSPTTDTITTETEVNANDKPE